MFNYNQQDMLNNIDKKNNWFCYVIDISGDFTMQNKYVKQIFKVFFYLATFFTDLC